LRARQQARYGVRRRPLCNRKFRILLWKVGRSFCRGSEGIALVMRTRSGIRRLLRYCIQHGVSCFFNAIDRDTDRYYDLTSDLAPSPLRSSRLRNSRLILNQIRPSQMPASSRGTDRDTETDGPKTRAAFVSSEGKQPIGKLASENFARWVRGRRALGASIQ